MKKHFSLLILAFICGCSSTSAPIANGPAHPFYSKFKKVIVTYTNIPESHYSYYRASGLGPSGTPDSQSSETDTQQVSTNFVFNFDSSTFRESGDTITGFTQSNPIAPGEWKIYLRVDQMSGTIDSANISHYFEEYHIGSSGSTQISSYYIRCRQFNYSRDSSSISSTLSGDSLNGRLIDLYSYSLNGPYNPHPGITNSFTYQYIGKPQGNSSVSIQFIP